MRCPSSRSFKDGVRQKDTRVLEKLSFKREKERRPEPAPQPEIAPRTGLNYVELAYEKYMTEQKRRGLHTLQDGEDPS